ncbi:MAG TPA: hypothetical protein QGH10_17190 [Armatimonadota bacterium]|nr:hypothetical protein [Armatimonadota bacterium]
MAAKRLRKRKPNSRPPWSPATPDAEEHAEPFMLTCTGCGQPVESTEHACPSCTTVFHQRPGTAPRIESGQTPRQLDAEAVEFSDRMDGIEKWTRIICILIGTLAAIAFVTLLLLGSIRGSFLFVVIALVCLARGLYGGDKDLHVLEWFGGWSYGRWRFRR